MLLSVSVGVARVACTGSRPASPVSQARCRVKWVDEGGQSGGSVEGRKVKLLQRQNANGPPHADHAARPSRFGSYRRFTHPPNVFSASQQDPKTSLCFRLCVQAYIGPLSSRVIFFPRQLQH